MCSVQEMQVCSALENLPSEFTTLNTYMGEKNKTVFEKNVSPNPDLKN